TVLLGQGAYVKDIGSGHGITYYNQPVNNYQDASFAWPTVPDDITGYSYTNNETTLSSLFARVNYDFKEKYLFTGIIRRDGSSRFGANNKYGVFPSFSAGWVPTKEDFWEENKIVNFLKVRGGYGVTGNDEIGNYGYLSVINGGYNYTIGNNGAVAVGNTLARPQNRDIAWEETAMTNIGFDSVLFEDFTFTFEWYNKKTSGMLLQVAVPGYVGNSGPIGNVADMTNKGFEFELGFNKQFGDLSFRMSANGSFIDNKVVFLGDDKTFLGGQTITPQGLQVTRTQVGYAIGSFYGFRSNGLFQNNADVVNYKNAAGTQIQPGAKPGDIRFVDLNGDGQINEDDREIIGDPTPDFTYGLSFNLGWKGFDLYMLGTGVAGNQIFNGLRRFDLPSANYTTDILDRWRGEGTSNTMPRLTTADDNKNYSRVSSLFLEDGTYFRIKVLQLGYTLPTTFTKRAGVNKVRFYVMANNLLTLTKYTGYDPEIGGGSYGVDRGFYPQARTFFAGINVGF
ncbi:MAG: SusC/RagA family TonB-linked outer membrane protein, partial [Chitinophagaceae bacterium]